MNHENARQHKQNNRNRFTAYKTCKHIKRIGGLVVSANDKETLKALYRRGGYIPYHITTTSTLIKREERGKRK